jgi:putative acetyltransferase
MRTRAPRGCKLGRQDGRMLTMDARAAVLVREEQPGDRAQVRNVNEAAFGRSDEANLIDSLRLEGVVLLSLVAEVDGRIAGHILWSRMTVETAEGSVAAVALAPMAVLPEHQGRGIGSELVRRGLDRLRDRRERIVIVLGHERYYSRFGFSTGKARHLASPFPPEAFMALELYDGALAGIRGAVRYPAAFGL